MIYLVGIFNTDEAHSSSTIKAGMSPEYRVDMTKLTEKCQFKHVFLFIMASSERHIVLISSQFKWTT